MNPVVWVVVALALGILGRTLVPYLQTLQENPDTKFDRKFLIPAAVSCLLAVFTLPFAVTNLPPELLNATQVSLLLLATAFVAGWGVTDLIRTGQKSAVG